MIIKQLVFRSSLWECHPAALFQSGEGEGWGSRRDVLRFNRRGARVMGLTRYFGDRVSDKGMKEE